MTDTLEDLIRAARADNAGWISVAPHPDGEMATVRYGPRGSTIVVDRDPVAALLKALADRPATGDPKERWAAAARAARGEGPTAQPDTPEQEDIFG